MQKQYKDEQPVDDADRTRSLQALTDTLLGKRDEAVRARAASGIEQRWRDDQAAYELDARSNSPSMLSYATGTAWPQAAGGAIRSQAIVNVVRGKVEVAAGRFSDIMLPVEERNWDLDPTPVVDLVRGANDDRQVIDTTTGQPMQGEDGKPVRARDIAKRKMDAAEEAMRGMVAKIEDQLTECSYNGECRKAIRTAARLGTGILRGPNAVKRLKRVYTPEQEGDATVHVLQVREESAPESTSRDPWCVYPAPGCNDDVQKTAEYVCEVEEALPRDVQNMIGVPGYFDEVLFSILQEDPLRIKSKYINGKYRVEKESANRGAYYEKWLYSGDINRSDLEAIGIDCGNEAGQVVSACAVIINDRLVKIELNVLETGDLNYDFFQWTPVDGSPWGIGISRMAIWIQEAIIQTWRSMLDNGRDSSGANVILDSRIEPVDGVWELTGKKAWQPIEKVDDVRKLFAQFQLESRQADLQAIIELGFRLLDIETGTPTMFQGEGKMDMPETLGATNIVVDSNNVTVRSRVKLWDDQITMPHLTRYYHWNMQYDDDPDIKGDYNVSPKGVSVLLARDQMAQSLLGIFKLKGDPDVDREVDWGKAVRGLLESLKLDVAKSDEDRKAEEEAEANQPPPENPAMQVAQIRTQGELQKAQLNQESDMAELQLKAQIAEQDRQHELTMKQMEYEMRMMEFAQQSGLRLQDIKADLAKEASKQNLQRELSVQKAMGPQVATPTVEPAGRAPEGQAYQR